ncbi:hypothetical protein SLEP1_g2962 [Rubroshorea leprosula]|uniref:Uncharacterized protein n=1 Tax=Rubroshorea leprosula TaxID=152421 RepID=A0AAV5HIW0_9ROSI|nr:hypothetical protein SLEP1_g2962 [Rubroshorea leprosula]
MKDVKYFSSESSEGEEISLNPNHVPASKLRWANYPFSSSESFLPALVTEATSGDPDALLKAMEGLRKANNQAASSLVAEKTLENKEDSLRTSDRGKQVAMEESLEQEKQEQLDRTTLQDAFRDTTHAIVTSLTFSQLKLSVDDVIRARQSGTSQSSLDMHWGLLYNLQANMPHTFEELATHAHDLEIQISRHGNFLPTDAHDKKKSQKDVKREVKPSKAKETMAVTTAPMKISQQKPKPNPKQGIKIVKDQGQNKKSTLKELQQKKYPFADSKVPAIFEQLLALNLIELPAPKHPEEVGRVNDPKYCKYHRIVSHLIDKCFLLIDMIVRLEKEGKIQLESEEGSAATNVAMVSFGSFSPVPFLPVQPTLLMVQPKEFGPHLPKGAIQVKFQTNDEEKIAYAYLGMPTFRGPSSLSLYDLMTVNLEDWESSSESEDKVSDGWSTFVSKSKKHRNLVSSGMPLPNPHKVMYGIYPEIMPTGWCSNFEFPAFYNDDDGWIPVQSRRRRRHSRPTLPTIQQNHSLLPALPTAPKNQEQRQLPWDTCLALVQAMLDPESFQGELAKPETKAEYLGTITFTDEDL